MQKLPDLLINCVHFKPLGRWDFAHAYACGNVLNFKNGMTTRVTSFHTISHHCKLLSVTLEVTKVLKGKHSIVSPC